MWLEESYITGNLHFVEMKNFVIIGKSHLQKPKMSCHSNCFFFLIQKFEIVDKEIESVVDKMVNRTMMEELMGQISQEILDFGTTAASNISDIAAAMETMTSSLQQTTEADSSKLRIDLDVLKIKFKQLTGEAEELRQTDIVLRSDLVSI